MKYGKELFLSYSVVWEKLPAYGFRPDGEDFVAERELNGGAFVATIRIDPSGKVTGTVTEREFGEEYAPIDIPSYQGGFIADLRGEYEAFLSDVREKCFRKEYFASAQANRLAQYVGETYGESVEYPFDETPQTSGVFRYKGNRKWYALVMLIERKKVDRAASKEKINVVNCKIDESKREELLRTPGVYPAYHMNKQKWVTALLDDTIPDEWIRQLVDTSRRLVAEKKK